MPLVFVNVRNGKLLVLCLKSYLQKFIKIVTKNACDNTFNFFFCLFFSELLKFTARQMSLGCFVLTITEIKSSVLSITRRCCYLLVERLKCKKKMR